MKNIIEYVNNQIESLSERDRNKTLSEYGLGKLEAFLDVAEQCQECKELYQAEEIWQAENPKQNKSNE